MNISSTAEITSDERNASKYTFVYDSSFFSGINSTEEENVFAADRTETQKIEVIS